MARQDAAAPVFNAIIGELRADGHATINNIAAQYITNVDLGSDNADDSNRPWLIGIEEGKVPFFTGRQEALTAILSVFWPPPPLSDVTPSQPRRLDRQKITISGVSGAGKTTVALQYAYAHKAQYYVVFLLKARTADELAISAGQCLKRIIDEYRKRWGKVSPGPLSELCQRVACALGIFDEPVVDFDHLVKEVINTEHSVERLMAWLPSSLPWLLIFDGYDDPAGFDIDSLLPNTGAGHVLITSQNPDASRTDKQIAIPPSLPQSESVALLQNAAGGRANSCCPGGSGLPGCTHMQEIVNSVGCLTAAISLIGDYLREKKGELTFANYLRPPSSMAKSVGETKVSFVTRAFDKAFGGLSPAARDLMQLCSLMADSEIPIRLFRGGIGVVSWMTDDIALNKVVAEFRSLSLVSTETGNLSIHSLLYEHARTTIDKKRDRQMFEWVVEMVTSTFDFSEDRSADQWMYEGLISPHIDSCSKILQSELAPSEGSLDPQTMKLAYLLARAYSQRGNLETAATLYELGLRGFTPQATGNLIAIDMMNAYGVTQRLRDKLESAEDLHLRAKTLIEAGASASPDLGADDSKESKMLEVRQHLATVLTDRRKYLDAKGELEEVLKKQRQRQGPDEISTASLKTQLEIGRVLQLMGEPLEAKKTLQLVRKACEAKFSDHHPMTLEAAHAVATVLEEMGDYDEALGELYGIRKKQERYLGENHFSTLDTIHTIASLYERQGLYGKALEETNEVVGKLKNIFREAAHTHPWMLVVRSGEADIQLRQGRYGVALDGYRSVFNGFVARHMAAEAWSTQTNIARVLRDTGKYVAALAECEAAIRGLQSDPDQDPSFVTAAEFCKATILELQGQFEEALLLYRGVSLKEKMPSEVHRFESLRTQCHICSATAKKGGYMDALYMYGEVEAELKNLGEQERVLIALLVKHGKADIFEHRAKHSEPDDPKRSEWCQRAVELYGAVCSEKEARGMKDADYYRAIHGRGRVYIHMGEYEMGEGRFLEAILGWKRIFGREDHPFIFMALEDRGNAMLQRGEALESAHRLCSEALQGCEKSLRSGHPQTCRARMSLAAVLLKQGSLDKALELYGASLREHQGEFGDNHAWTREVRDILLNLDAAPNLESDLAGKVGVAKKSGEGWSGDATSEESLCNCKVAASRRGGFRAVMESLCCFPAGSRLRRRGQHKETLEP